MICLRNPVPRAKVSSVMASALLLVAPSAARAADIDSLQSLTQPQFRMLAEDLVAALSYKAISPAESLGVTGFDLGVGLSVTETSGSVWKLVTGSDTDYLLKVVMPDMDYYQRFLLDKLNQIEGVSSIRTSFVLRQVVQRTEMPLNHI